MDIPGNLIPVFWAAVVLSTLSGAGLGIGMTLLLGTVSHRKIALPLVWIAASTLIASMTALILILTHG